MTLGTLWGFLLTLFVYAIPIIIVLFIIVIQELLDLILHKKDVESLIKYSENINIESIEQDLIFYSDKLKSMSEWTLMELDNVAKNKELDNRLNSTYKKKKIDEINRDREGLRKELIEIRNKYWYRRWKPQKTHFERNRELKFRKLFYIN